MTASGKFVQGPPPEASKRQMMETEEEEKKGSAKPASSTASSTAASSSNKPGEKDKIEGKHESFEAYLAESKKKGAIFQTFSYKVKPNCPNHKPFPQGMCNKCLPPAVVLKRQTYRHIDFVSFMNYRELGGFVGYWQQSGLMEQRIAFLYGYYSEDPNYPEGVRVNVEAIYEPPQIGEFSGVQELEDPSKRAVD